MGLAALLVVCVALAVWLFPLKQHEADSEAISIAVSQVELDEVAGIHTDFDGEEVFEVAGTAHGALLVTDDGVISLAGEQWPLARDGQWDEQWRYLARRSLNSVNVLPEGERVAITYGEVGARGHSVVILESETGDLAGGTRIGGRFGPEDEIHLASTHLLRRSGKGMSAYPLNWDGEVAALTDEASWSITDDEFCSGTSIADDVQVAGTAYGFAVSVRCTGEGGDSHMVAHLNGDSGGERWRLDWNKVEPGIPYPEIRVISAAIPVGSSQDIVPDLLDKDSRITYAVAMEQRMDEESLYSVPLLFDEDEWTAEEYLSPPLQNTRELPEALLLGDAQDLDDHLTFQGALTLVDDPDTALTREDISLLRWPSDGEWKQPNTYRAYPPESSFKWDFIRELKFALS